MEVMDKIKVRRRILEILYEQFVEHPYNRTTPKEFKEQLGISLRDLNYNMIYLEDKGLVELQKPLEGSLFVGARITYRGIDLVENEYEFDIMFPVVKRALPPDNVFNQFTLLIDAIEVDDTINSDLKELIIEGIKEIIDELKKVNPSYAVVKKFLVKVKERNYDIGEKLQAILKNPLISKILADSAKKELEDL
jgi:DNA-binding Lrp family transcriptional regulator